MRVVLDTNVLVSGIFFTGPPATILAAWASRRFELVASIEVLAEYRRVGARLESRYRLVEAAWILLVRAKSVKAQPLQAWAQRIAARRGRRVAVVALARRLAGILYAMMRDGTEFDGMRLAPSADRLTATA